MSRESFRNLLTSSILSLCSKYSIVSHVRSPALRCGKLLPRVQVPGTFYFVTNRIQYERTTVHELNRETVVPHESRLLSSNVCSTSQLMCSLRGCVYGLANYTVIVVRRNDRLKKRNKSIAFTRARQILTGKIDRR